MARTLKLDCITLSVTKKGDDSPCSFDEFFSYTFKGKTIHRPFRDFFITYVESFNGKFLASAGVSKAINLATSSVQWNNGKRTISGFVEGGNTGVTGDVKESDNASVTLFSFKPGQVSAEPFYFLLWMPKDYDKGILLVQGYTNSSVSDVFKQTLLEFFRLQCPSYVLRTGTYVDKASIDRFMDEAKINSVTFRRTRLVSDVAEDTQKTRTNKETKVKVDVKITDLSQLEGFNDRVARWVKKEVPALFEVEDMEAMGVEGEVERIIGYETPLGRQASAKSRTDFEIKPVIYIDPLEVPCEANGRPEPTKIQVYLLEELARVQKEIGYTDAKKP
jgi:hypothetical protein